MALTGKKVLVVDDEEGFREILTEQFQFYGADVTTSDCGSNALELLKFNKFDAVVSDIRMPHGDGIFLLDQIGKSDLELPAFIFVTGFAEFNEIELKNKGVLAIFSKPFVFEEILKVLSAEMLTGPKKKMNQSNSAK